MDQPRTQADLLATVRRVQADQDALVAAAGENRLNTPEAFGPWSLRDMVAHLAAWRWYSVARMEAARDSGEPVSPWPDFPEPDEADVDDVNAVIFAETHDRSAAEVLADSAASFDRLTAAIEALSDDALFTPGRYAWLGDHALAAVVDGMQAHFDVDHAPDIRAWLAGNTAD